MILFSRVKSFFKEYRTQLLLSLTVALMVGFSFSIGFIMGARVFQRAPIVIEKMP